jgi:hypothetical protein
MRGATQATAAVASMFLLATGCGVTSANGGASGVPDASPIDGAPSDGQEDAAPSAGDGPASDGTAQDAVEATELGPVPALDGAACMAPYVVQITPPMLNLSTFAAYLAIDPAGNVCPALGYNTATLVFTWTTYGSPGLFSAVAPWQVVAASPGTVAADGASNLPQDADVTLVVAQGSQHLTLIVRAHLVTTATMIGGTLTLESVSSVVADAAGE